MKKITKLLSVLLIVSTVVCMFFCLNITASAAETSLANAITYNSKTGYTSYINNYYTISKNKTVTLKAYYINKSVKLEKQTIAGKNLKSLLMFDVHIIDTKTGKVVNYWYNLKVGDKFKVYSSISGINSSKYQVKVTSYLSNYKSFKNSNLVTAAMNIKYSLSY